MAAHLAPWAVALRSVTRWLPWLCMILILADAEPAELRAGPGLWVLLALAGGRLSAWLWSGAPAAGEHAVIWACSGPVAYLVWIHDRERIPEALRWLSPFLAGFLALKLIGVAYLINLNLMGNALLLCLAGWLAHERPWRQPGLWLTAAALLATTSRGAALGAVVMTAGYLSYLPVAIPVAVGSWIALQAARPTNTVGRRLAIWSSYLGQWLRSPLIGNGAGWDHWPASVHGHNVIVTSLCWDGVLGAGLLAAGIVPIIRQRHRWPAWALWGLVGAGLHLLVDDFTVAPLSMALMAALLAAV